MNPTISFDKKKKNSLKRAYLKAVKGKKEVFVFEGIDLSTRYAKYLLQYLDTIIK
jgi:hypothetical protein